MSCAKSSGRAPDRLLEIARHFAGHRQQHIRVFAQLLGQRPDPGLGRRRLDLPLDLAQVRGLDPHRRRQLAHRKGRILLFQDLSALADITAKSTHSVEYILNTPQLATFEAKESSPTYKPKGWTCQNLAGKSKEKDPVDVSKRPASVPAESAGLGEMRLST